MENNNTIIYSFGLIFLLLGFFQPIIQAEFNQEYTVNDDGVLEEVTQSEPGDVDVIKVLSAIFFWVFGAPAWLNLILTMMRVVFWVIVYDKLSPLSSGS